MPSLSRSRQTPPRQFVVPAVPGPRTACGKTMLSGALSPILGILLVVIGVIAVWLMFDASRSAPQSPRATRMIQAHRIAGYLFVALFCLMTWFMILKVKGRTY